MGLTKQLPVTVIVLLTFAIGGLSWRLTAATQALAQRERQIKELTAALAGKSGDGISEGVSTRRVPDSQIYTLYRSSPTAADLRIHVGTFDTQSFDEPTQNKHYNYEMCADAQLNFNQRNQGGSIRFWCEEGRFRERLP